MGPGGEGRGCREVWVLEGRVVAVEGSRGDSKGPGGGRRGSGGDGIGSGGDSKGPGGGRRGSGGDVWDLEET
eukprot:9175042-Pyramimonas_sp.AAC.1